MLNLLQRDLLVLNRLGLLLHVTEPQLTAKVDESMSAALAMKVM